MIVRDCARELERCLKSFAAYPDEIVIVNTGIDENEPGFKETNAVAESFGAKVFHFPWVEDFSAARNFSFSKCENDVVMWLDADDTVENAKDFARIIRQVLGSGGLEVLYAEYLYDFDERGQCTTILTRERVVNRRFFEWRAPIHEVLCETYHCRGTKIPAQFGRIIHNRQRNEPATKKSLERNLRVLEHHFLPKEQGGLGEYCEERMLFYWANTYMGLGRYEDAVQKYLEYIPRSGSQAEIQQALGNASEACRLIGHFDKAKGLAFQAIERNPDAPTPYWFMAQAHLRGGSLDNAIHYAMCCLERASKFEQEMVANPKVIFGGAALLIATAKYKQNKIDDVEPMLQIAEKYYGKDDPGIKEMRQNVAEARRKRELLNAYNTLRSVAEQEGRGDDIRSLARATPAAIRDSHEVARYLPKTRPDGKRSIAFLCGGGMPGLWGPELLKTGIGGSEEAVCYLSEQFAKAGWHVEVYAPCKRQTWNGVEWYAVEDFSGDDDQDVLDVLVVWRTAWTALHFGTKAKRVYLWLHDMPDRSCWMDGLWNGFDGIFCLSEFHKQVYDFLPAEKKVLSANGLPLDRLVPVDQLVNEPHRFIYASCPTRGLETVLLWWEKIKKEIPDAELDVFYGFHPTLLEHAKVKTPYGRQLTQTIQQIDQLRKQDGVNWRGFVGHEELHLAMSRAGLWLYPTCFPEISCITAMKMMAHGVVPVTVNQFALKETVTHGVKIDGQMHLIDDQAKWFQAVIDLAKNPWTKERRQEMALAARANFDWAKVCEQWRGLFEESLKSPKANRIYPRGRLDLVRAAI